MRLLDISPTPLLPTCHHHIAYRLGNPKLTITLSRCGLTLGRLVLRVLSFVNDSRVFDREPTNMVGMYGFLGVMGELALLLTYHGGERDRDAYGVRVTGGKPAYGLSQPLSAMFFSPPGQELLSVVHGPGVWYVVLFSCSVKV